MASVDPPLELNSLGIDILHDSVYPAFRNWAVMAGFPGAKDAIVRHVNEQIGLAHYDSQRNCILLEHGKALRALLAATISPGDQVILTDPTANEFADAVTEAGGIPVWVPLIFQPGLPWMIDLPAFAEFTTSTTRAMILQSPAIPTGAYFNDIQWQFIGTLCASRDVILIVETFFDTVLFYNLPVIYPAKYPSLADRTFTIGTGSGVSGQHLHYFEWVVGPAETIALMSSHNLDQDASRVDLNALAACQPMSELHKSHLYAASERMERTFRTLRGLPIGRPSGGWSLLLRVSDFGLTAERATTLFDAAGALVKPVEIHRSDDTSQYVEIIFARESLPRLSLSRKVIKEPLDALASLPQI